MKKIVLAALAALTFSASVASAQNLLPANRPPSPEFTYSTAGG